MKHIDLPPVRLLATLVIAWVWRWPAAWDGSLWPGILCLVAAGVLMAAAILEFRRARTTIVPRETPSALVTGGIYRFSRNPMYLGLLLGLAGWAAHLGNLSCFVLLPVFVCYITRFQIMPEELALASKFGRDFDTYCRSVRRWF